MPGHAPGQRQGPPPRHPCNHRTAAPQPAQPARRLQHQARSRAVAVMGSREPHLAAWPRRLLPWAPAGVAAMVTPGPQGPTGASDGRGSRACGSFLPARRSSPRTPVIGAADHAAAVCQRAGARGGCVCVCAEGCRCWWWAARIAAVVVAGGRGVCSASEAVKCRAHLVGAGLGLNAGLLQRRAAAAAALPPTPHPHHHHHHHHHQAATAAPRAAAAWRTGAAPGCPRCEGAGRDVGVRPAGGAAAAHELRPRAQRRAPQPRSSACSAAAHLGV
jgi:hypothetical protein